MSDSLLVFFFYLFLVKKKHFYIFGGVNEFFDFFFIITTHQGFPPSDVADQNFSANTYPPMSSLRPADRAYPSDCFCKPLEFGSYYFKAIPIMVLSFSGYDMYQPSSFKNPISAATSHWQLEITHWQSFLEPILITSPSDWVCSNTLSFCSLVPNWVSVISILSAFEAYSFDLTVAPSVLIDICLRTFLFLLLMTLIGTLMSFT